MRSNWLIKIGLELDRLKYTVEEYCNIVEQYSMGIVNSVKILKWDKSFVKNYIFLVLQI